MKIGIIRINTLIFMVLFASCAFVKVSCSALDDYFIAIYIGDPVYPQNNSKVQSYINDLKSSGFNVFIVWSVHVLSNGDLVLNDKLIVSNGSYVGDPTFYSYLAQLKEGPGSGNKIYFSVGSAGTHDFQNIHDLITSQGTGPNSILNKNFAALMKELPLIDGIDLDAEDLYDKDSLVAFSLMVGDLGCGGVSFCPYENQTFWIDCANTINQQKPDLVTHFNLQCYAGGAANDPADWAIAIAEAGLTIPVYPGQWCLQYNGAGEDPGLIQEQFSTWRYDSVKGGFIWLYDYIPIFGPSTAAYASAIKQGLGVENQECVGIMNKDVFRELIF